MTIMIGIEKLCAEAEQLAKASLSASKTIAAGEVVPGDLIYNKGAYCPGHAWIRVISVEKSEESGSVILETTDWTTYKHPREGVAVKRALWK